MIILIMALAIIVLLVYMSTVIFEIRDKTNNVYPELMKIIAEQRDILQGTLDAAKTWCDIGEDIINHIDRVEDMEGDIKDIFEWIHSVDNNIADMRRDIQDTETKLGDLMAVYDRNILKFDNDVKDVRKDIQLIQDHVANTLKIRKDISEIKEYLGFEDEEEYDLTHITVDNANHGDTDGDIPMNVIKGHGNYRQFLSSSDKDVDALYKEVIDHAIKNMNAEIEGDDEDDDNRDE